ncbi:H3Y2 [Symbiodinium natans]|uniref:H3Y2 protein n=1 Tax=Symbiodinium natans TaxID=878477 RepID=A0A812I531_9DINO|nr:H3Y2 [Symbiodinium natans]CAE7419831.1 H3Y2 [Symbiodinium natans]
MRVIQRLEPKSPKVRVKQEKGTTKSSTAARSQTTNIVKLENAQRAVKVDLDLEDLTPTGAAQNADRKKVAAIKGRSVRQLLDDRLIRTKRFLLPKTVMMKVMREILQEMKPGFRMQPDACRTLQQGAELFLDSVFHRSNVFRQKIDAERETLLPLDMQLALM